ncbi:MAG: hypothetical protein ACREOJ_19325 [Gemmatimonadaceae bacterium]
MSTAREEILAGPNPIATLKTDGATNQQLADNLFINFLSYAKRNWHYIASAQAGGDALLAGTATTVPCGGIATALKALFEQDLGIPKTDVEYITISGYVWTKPQYLCFDPQVIGNVRDASNRDYRNGCVFNEHYYLRCGAKFYDPCLSANYSTRDECVLMKPTVLFKGEFMLSPDKQTVLMFHKTEKVNGWQQGAWSKFPAKDFRKHVQKIEIEKLSRFSTTFAAFATTV